MQFAVERHLLEDFTPVGLEGGAEVVDIHAAQFGHQPVGTVGRYPSQPEIVGAALAPTADNVVAFCNLLQENWVVRRVMLEIAVDGDDVLTECMVDAGGQGRSLVKVEATFADRYTAIDSSSVA